MGSAVGKQFLPYDESDFNQTKNQIQKDFSLSGISLDIGPEIKEWQQLSVLLEPILLHLFHTKPEQLMAVLYRFDILKTQIDVALQRVDGGIEKRLAFIVMQRAYSKVISRKQNY